MFSRRVAITRERLTRITFRAGKIVFCEICGHVLVLTTIGTLPREDMPQGPDEAIASGRVHLVCLWCATQLGR